MSTTPSVIVFDVNETLSNLSPMSDRFTEVGAPAQLAKLWFASLLRDGFALAAAGDKAAFGAIGADALRGMLADTPLNRDLDEAVDYIVSGLAELDLHDDVADAVRALAATGVRLVTLTNGSAQVAEGLFAKAGIRDQFEALLSVEDAPAWKPARSAYEYAATACGVDLAAMLLVASHPWDIHGASRAGMQTAWLNRAGATYPGYFAAPDHTLASLGELAGVLDSAERR